MPALTTVKNPITHSDVRLYPPLEVLDVNEANDLIIEIAWRCKLAWDHQEDLTEIKDLRGIVFRDAAG